MKTGVMAGQARRLFAALSPVFARMFAPMLASMVAAALILAPRSDAAASALTAAPAAATEVPYRIDYDGWLTISVFVNGSGPHDFILDTGASTTLVFRNLSELQHFPPVEGVRKNVLAAGSQAVLPAVRIGDLAIGAERFDDLVSVVLDDWRSKGRSPQGIIGIDFLSRYIVTIDAERRIMRLEPPRRMASPDARWRKAAMRLENFGLRAGDFYVIDGQINGKPVGFLVDTGASRTIINGSALRAQLPKEPQMRVIQGGDVGGAVLFADALNDLSVARRLRVQRLRLGAARWLKVEMIGFDAPIFDDLSMNDQPFGLLGADLLTDRSLILDFPGRTIWFGPRTRMRRP